MANATNDSLYAEINPDYLDGFDLSYELRIRGITTIRDLSEMRNRLREFLREASPESSVIQKELTVSQIEWEKSWCHKILMQIERDLKWENVGQLDVMRSRLIHVLLRLERNEANSGCQGLFLSLIQKSDGLLHRCHQLLNPNQAYGDTIMKTDTVEPDSENELSKHTEFNDRSTKNFHGVGDSTAAATASTMEELLNTVRLLSGGLLDVQGQLSQLRLNTNAGEDSYRPERAQEPPRRFGLPIAKWNIEKFDGKPECLALFLAKLDRYAQAEGATPNDLLQGSVHLFTGRALAWVLNVEVTTWDELKRELTRYVHGASTDRERMTAIEKMKQGSESAADYINDVLLQFRSLRVQPEEQEKVDIILQGLRPNIGVALASNITLNTVRDVQVAAMRVERIIKAQRSVGFVETVNSIPATVDPDVPEGFVEAFDQRSRNGQRFRRAGTPPPSRDGSADRKVRCFNCGLYGHRTEECRGPLTCWGCGAVNVRQTDCTFCQAKN